MFLEARLEDLYSTVLRPLQSFFLSYSHDLNKENFLSLFPFGQDPKVKLYLHFIFLSPCPDSTNSSSSIHLIQELNFHFC